jgi:branched-chain amino acid transport system substrate-binding protein
MLQAQASGADVIGIANGGDDAINAVKSAREFNVTAKQKVVPFGLDSLPAIRSASLQLAQGMMYVSPWLPDLDDASKAFFARFLERRKVAPSTFQVGTYSVVRSYLKAVEATNSDDPKMVIAKMRETPVKDAFTSNGRRTAGWCMTSMWSRSSRPRNRRANGIFSNSWPRCQAIRCFVRSQRAAVRA